MKTNLKRYLLWGLLLLVVVVLLALALEPRPVPADFARATRGPLVVTLDEEGETRIRERFVISAPLAGKVLRVELEPGDPVVARETVLATFEPGTPTFLDARSRAQAEARVDAAGAALQRARAERQKAAAELRYARAEEERFTRLAAEGIASQEELDSAQLRAQTAGEALQVGDFAAESARHDLLASRAALLQDEAPSAKSTMSLRSPVDGVVLRRLRESEALVPSGEAILEVGDPAELEIVADFLSTDAVKIQPGQRAFVERWGGDRPLEARVRRVEPSGFLKVSALGVEEQRVNVVLDFEGERTAWQRLGDGFRVEVRVVVWEADDVLRVPTSSLFRHGSAWAVFAVEAGRAIVREVQVGHRNGIEAEIVSGLAEGRTVIVHPSDSIEDGSAVEEREV